LLPHQCCAPGIPVTNCCAFNASRRRIPQYSQQLWRTGCDAFVALHTSDEKVMSAVLRNRKGSSGIPLNFCLFQYQQAVHPYSQAPLHAAIEPVFDIGSLLHRIDIAALHQFFPLSWQWLTFVSSDFSTLFASPSMEFSHEQSSPGTSRRCAESRR
jgi:hypothetical protein